MKKILYIIVVIGLAILNAVPVLAATTAVVTVLGVPQFGAGILSFNVNYVSDTEMDLSWTVSASTANVMVRAKYGSYPVNPANVNTAPSDGYLVYYGSNLSAIDTSMDMNQNGGILYYSAWSQNIDGTWNLVPSQSSKESKELILIAFLGTFIGLIAVNAMVRRSSFLPLRLILAFTFVIPLIWLTSSPPSPFVAGSSLMTAMVILIIGALLIFLFASFRRQTEVTRDMAGNFTAGGERSGGWFWQNQNEVEEERDRVRAERSQTYKTQMYRNRMHRALNPEEYDSNGRRIRR